MLLRVIGYHVDKGGRYAACELLDWIGDAVPSEDAIGRLAIRREDNARGISQFLFQEPRKKRDQARLTRTGLRSVPAQQLGGYTCLVWPYVDRLLQEFFGLA